MNLLPMESPTEEPLFLFRAFRAGLESSRLSASDADALQGFLSDAASEFMDAWVIALPHGQAQERALSDAAHCLNIGVELRSGGNVEQALEELGQKSFVTAFQAGKSALAQLRRRTEELRGGLRLRNPMPTALAILDELSLTNAFEDIFLEELSRNRRALTKTAPRLTESPSPRPVACLRDISLASAMLDNLEARREIFGAFPQNRLFSENYPSDAYGDAARVVVSRWFVRMAVSGRESFDVQVTESDIQAFRERAGEPETAEILERRIDRFVQARISASHQHAATAYLLSCLNDLPDVLDWLL